MAVYSLAPRPRGGAARQEDIVPGFVLGTKANLTVRLADGAADIDAAQHLRYRVFYEELDAKPDQEALATRRDADRYDAICDHLLVVRKGAANSPDEIRVKDGEVGPRAEHEAWNNVILPCPTARARCQRKDGHQALPLHAGPAPAPAQCHRLPDKESSARNWRI